MATSLNQGAGSSCQSHSPILVIPQSPFFYHGVFLTHLPEDRLSEGRGGFAGGAEGDGQAGRRRAGRVDLVVSGRLLNLYFLPRIMDPGETGRAQRFRRSWMAVKPVGRRSCIPEKPEGFFQAGRRRAGRFDLAVSGRLSDLYFLPPRARRDFTEGTEVFAKQDVGGHGGSTLRSQVACRLSQVALSLVASRFSPPARNRVESPEAGRKLPVGFKERMVRPCGRKSGLLGCADFLWKARHEPGCISFLHAFPT